MSELDKLAKYLEEKGYNFKRKDKNDSIYPFHSVVVYDDKDNYLWDAICHRGSYGYEQGLLEIMGTVVDVNAGDSVEGWLTAQEIIDRLEAGM